jgi:exosortase F-associated protein
MSKPIRILLICLLFLLLIVLRGFAAELFYDPLIEYFQNNYLHKKMPDIDTWHLVVDMLFRYSLNSLISLGIIWLTFQRISYVKFSVFFLMLAFIILIVAFVFLIGGSLESGYLLLFYIRRFIIHPLFLLLLLPAFYYQQLSKE